MGTTRTNDLPWGAGWGTTIRVTGLALAVVLALVPALAGCSDDSPADRGGAAVTTTLPTPPARHSIAP